MKASVLIGDLINTSYLGDFEPIDYNTSLSKEGGTSTYYEINSVKPYAMLFIWLRGSYKKNDGTGKFNVNEIYYLNMISKTTGTIKGDTRTKIINLVSSK